MKLKQLGKEIGKVFEVDETLKLYLYNNRIEVVDYTSSFEQDSVKFEESFSSILTLGIRDNKIITVKSSMGFITPANKDLYIYLANLIGTYIEDYDDYEKLLSVPDTKCIDINFI